MSACRDTETVWSATPDGWNIRTGSPQTLATWLRDFMAGEGSAPMTPAPHPSARPRNRSASRRLSVHEQVPAPPADWVPFWLLRKARWAVMLAAAIGLGAGGEAARAGSFSLKPGDLLLANHGADTVLKIDLATGAVQNLGTFQGPTDVALSPDGLLYITEFAGSIYSLNLTNGTRTLVKPPMTADPYSDALWGVLLGPAGDLIVTRGYDNAVLRVNRVSGATQIVSSGNNLFGVAGLARLDADHVVVCSTFNHQIVKVALAGGAQAPIPTIGGGIDQPRGIAVSGPDLLVTALDSREIRRVPVTGGVVDTFYTAAASLFGMDVMANGDVVAGMDTAPFHVLRLSPAGALVHTFTNLLFSEITGLDVSGITLTVTGLLNTPPLLEPIADLTVNEGSLVSFVATATDTNWPPQTLSFSLGSNAPAGAVISSRGVFSWTPSAAQGPGTYSIQVIVTDDDSPPLSTTNSFAVTVNDVNTAPVFQPIPNQTVFEGQLLSLQVRAVDDDQPPQTLTYSLLPGSPPGATLSSNGVFEWTPSAAQGPLHYSIGVKVTDSGSPPISITTNFLVVVNELYLQCAPTMAEPFLDEPTAVYNWAAHSIAFPTSGLESCFCRLRSNLPVRFKSLVLNGGHALVEYEFQ